MLNFKSDGLSNVKRDAIVEATLKGCGNRTGNLYWGFKYSSMETNQHFYHMDVGYWHEVSNKPIRKTVNQSCYKWRISTNSFFNNKLAEVSYDRLTLSPPKKWNKSGQRGNPR